VVKLKQLTKAMEIKKEQLRYTFIHHDVRNKLSLTLIEYCIADAIYHLSNNPSSNIVGWCYASKEYIADMLGTSRQTIFSNLNKLLEKGLIERDDHTKHVRTTDKWYNEVVLLRMSKDYKETLHTDKKLDVTPTRNFTPDSKETGLNSNIYNNTNNIESKLSPKKEMELFLTSKECFDYVVKLYAEKLNVPKDQVKFEINKFTAYWTEPTPSGKKTRWEMQKTWDLNRRLLTWFAKKKEWNQSKVNKRKIGMVI
jgi:DNA-binding MarR family transcriptional regulator